tara:strand:- start:200 stop:631 length:432 start_codon:yes stop_codon:yes gene_type:complete
MKKLILIYLLAVSFCYHAEAQFNNFNRGGWNNGMQSFNRGSWNNGMQSFNRGGWGNNNFNRQFYPTSSGTGRTPVRYYGNNNGNQQGQQQNNNVPTSTENRATSLIMNNGYPYGLRQGQVGGYYRVDTKRNIWTLVPRVGLLK